MSLDARIAATYDYTDEAGELLFQSVRLRDPKDFRQRRPDGEAWKWDLEGVRLVLWRLPAVLAAAKRGRVIFVVEGEKDVEALESLGLIATCNPMGAGKFRKGYAAYLAGARFVVVVPDCDEPGRKHALKVCEILHEAGIPARLVDLDPERSDKYDVSDFVLEHGEGARLTLERLVKRIEPWPSNRPVELPIITFDSLAASVGDYDYSLDYLGPLIRGGERIHVIGPIGHGKTTFLAEALAAAVYGRDFLGFTGRDAGMRALYIDLEMPAEKLYATLAAARIGAGDGLVDIAHLPDGLEVDRNPKHREMIESAMSRYQIIVIDPWYKLIYDELADGMRNVRPVISFLDGLRKRYPRTAVVVGFHANEPQRGQRVRGLGDASGYKAYQRPCDTALMFERLRGNRSRLTWGKSRSPFLPPLGTEWLVEWERGAGFRRIERRSARDDLLEAVPRDTWLSVYDVMEATGRGKSHVHEICGDLVAEGRAQTRTSTTDAGRQRKLYLFPSEAQSRIEAA